MYTSDDVRRWEEANICEVCERSHELGRGWSFCTGEKYHNIVAGLRSVPEREEAYWRSWTQSKSGDLPYAARLLLPSVMARLLDAKADPNLCVPPLCCYVVSGAAVHEKLLITPLHTVLGWLETRQWIDDGSRVGQAEAVPECVKLLLQHKADLTLEDVWGRTPVQVVLQHRRAAYRYEGGGRCARVATRIVSSAEKCAEIMGVFRVHTDGEDIPDGYVIYRIVPATGVITLLPDHKREPANPGHTAWRFPSCTYCERNVSQLEWRRVGSCWGCWWQRFVVWCSECTAWKPLEVDSEVAAKTCLQCRVTVQRSRYFCDRCMRAHTHCECAEKKRKNNNGECRRPSCAVCGKSRARPKEEYAFKKYVCQACRNTQGAQTCGECLQEKKQEDYDEKK